MTNKKEAILDATIDRIAEQGFSFSTVQITSDVGCSQSLVFRYFPTKEKLISESFNKVCRELELALKQVKLPDVLTRESLNDYIMEEWGVYCSYLSSNGRIAKAYLYFVAKGTRFPRGFRSAEAVIKRLLGNRYDMIMTVYPDFLFVAEYLLMVSNVVASGKFVDWRSQPDSIAKLKDVLRNGIYGMGQAKA